MKLILTEDSPKAREEMLDQALTPGVEYSEDGIDYIWATPEALLAAKEILAKVREGLTKNLLGLHGCMAPRGSVAFGVQRWVQVYRGPERVYKGWMEVGAGQQRILAGRCGSTASCSG